MEKTTSQRVDSLSSLLSNIKLDSSPAVCSLAYRTLSCNHLHSLHSTTWQLQVKDGKGLAMWKGLDKLEGEDKKMETRTVRWKNEVGIDKKELLKEVNTLLEVESFTSLTTKLKNSHREAVIREFFFCEITS